MSEEINNESLQKSIKLVGELYPILENQNGKILDGNTRVISNPKHHRKTIQTKNRIEEILIRAHAHHRRRISQEETKSLIDELAKELEQSGVKKESISAKLVELLPYSPGYVRQLLSEQYKEPVKVEAAKISAQITTQNQQTVKTQETPQAIHMTKCERCQVTSSCNLWHNHWLCESDFKKAELNPEGYDGYFRYLEKGREAVVEKPLKPQSPMQMTKYGDREGMMKVQHGKMEDKIVQKLRAKGYKISTGLKITVYEVKTEPDFNIELTSGKMVRGYVDHEFTHGAKQMDRDADLRELLRKTEPGNLVVAVRVKGDSDKEADEKISEIEEGLRF